MTDDTPTLEQCPACGGTYSAGDRRCDCDLSDTTMTDTELVPVHLVAYDEDAELDVDYEADVPTIENHDELVNSGQTHDEIRAMSRESAEQYDMDIVEPGSSLWRDEFADLESGDSWRLD